MSDKSPFVDVQEASRFLGIKISTLYGWVHERRIPFRKHGRKLVFELEALKLWSQNNASQPLDEKTFFNVRSCGTQSPRQNAKTRSLKNESKSSRGSR